MTKEEIVLYTALGIAAAGVIYYFATHKPEAKAPDKPTGPEPQTPEPEVPGPIDSAEPMKKITPPCASLIWVEENLHPSWVEKAATCNLGRLYYKIMDDLGGDAIWSQAKSIPKLVERGFSLGGWGYHFTTNPKTKVVALPNKVKVLESINAALEMGMTHYIFDLEGELENQPERTKLCIEMIRYVKAGAKRPITLGFSSFGSYKNHRGFPYKEIAKEVNFHAPQIYTCFWGKNHLQLTHECMAEFEALNLGIPTYPMVSTENQEGVPYPLTADDLQSIIDTFPGTMVYRMHDADNSTAVNLKVDYHGYVKPAPVVVTPPSTGSSVAAKLLAGYATESGYQKVYANVHDWFAPLNAGARNPTTTNGCVAFMSSAVRIFCGIDVPKGGTSMVTRPFSDWLKSQNWKKITDPSQLIGGDVLFSEDAPNDPGYPAHTYMFVKWDGKPNYAIVIDNQGYMYSRNIMARGPKTPFAYCLRSPN